MCTKLLPTDRQRGARTLLGTSGLTTSLQVGERAEYGAVCVCVSTPVPKVSSHKGRY